MQAILLNLTGLIVSVLLLVYLAITMIFPERF